MTKRLFLLCITIALFFSLRVDAQIQLVGNSGFETGTAAPWTLNGSIISTNYAHTGNYFCWLGGLTSWTDEAYQTVTIPQAISSATLSFYYNIYSSEDGTGAYDFFIVRILDTNSPPNVLATVGIWSNMNTDPGSGNPYYHQYTYDMSSFAGKTVKIYFESQNDNTLPTSFFIDDVTIVATPAGGPADLTPQNVSLTPNPALVGGSVTVNYTVANIGGSNAPASHTKVVLKDSSNNIFSQQTFATSALAAGTSTNESHAIGLVGATAGNYTVTVTVDANSEVAQTNTVNDTSAPVALSVQTPAGLVINPIYDSTITSDPNSATIQATINAAIQQYETQFSDPITVTIQFSKMSSGLGQSLTYQSSIDYATFRDALSSDAQTTNDAVALASLPVSSVNPVNGNASVTLTTANLRALGISADPPSGAPDSTISLNTSIMNLTRSSIDPNKYDLMAVVQHEIDEALSLGSAMNGLANGAAPPTGPVFIMDLFRYAANGARSFDTSTNTAAYFSIDGTNDLVRFNQKGGGDFQDWYSTGSHTPRVQDAFGTPGATPNLGVELIALDVSGYNLVSAIPVPKIISTAKSGNTVTLTWTSQPGLTYQVQYKTNVTQVGWINLGSPITATRTTTSASDTIGASQRYYRVVVVNTSRSFVHRTLVIQPVLSVTTNSISPRLAE